MKFNTKHLSLAVLTIAALANQSWSQDLGERIRHQVYQQVQQELAAQGIPWSPPCYVALAQFAPQVHKRVIRDHEHRRLSYNELTYLAKISVAKIPELKAIWEFQRTSGHTIYFGGGGLRGLLHWITEQAKHHTPDEIRRLPVPSIVQLLRQPGSDIDLYAPSHIIPQIKAAMPQYKNWDILSLGTNEENVKMGGAGLEKLRINPHYIDDPLNGLRDYSNGVLHFHSPPDSVFKNAYWAHAKHNTRTSEALRFIRFLYNLPEVQASQDSIEKIRRVVPPEIRDLKRDPQVDYWIEKALAKLHLATGHNDNEFGAVLYKYGLLEPLRRQGYVR